MDRCDCEFHDDGAYYEEGGDEETGDEAEDETIEHRLVVVNVGSKRFSFTRGQAIGLLFLDGAVWISLGLLIARALH